MEHLHKILYGFHGKNKRELEHICGSGFPFKYRMMSFGFININHRCPEELMMNVKIPSPLELVNEEYSKAAEFTS